MRVEVSFGLQQGMDGVNRIVYSDLTSNAFLFVTSNGSSGIFFCPFGT